MEKLSWPPFLLDSFLSKRPICLFVKLANICLKDLASVISKTELKNSGKYNDFQIYSLFLKFRPNNCIFQIKILTEFQTNNYSHNKF